ncbi:MAG: haloacid dehalogenase [Betaproteobacteria bacterium RBG_16_58_11]|nr:MAG: haloacid dehalogenase [Betaproteobacteria bacterium RBG_16_58_11]OFZ98497.1 MAG: haloacid dehalogenase [Betaproteobacteria bacterium RBG_19FT_COMBO_58_11]
MISWNAIQTVLLDMDGTLLDLHYDNHFWLKHVPARYAEKYGLSLEASQHELRGRYEKVAGTMQWYCMDYWSSELGLDIERLKQEVAHLIAVHPHVAPFLERIRGAGKRVVLVTNAHHKSLALKMSKTRLDHYFDAMICAHALGKPKEHPDFWHEFQSHEAFNPQQTLLIDDSLPVLRSARNYGIAHLLAIYQPDTRQPRKDVAEFEAIESFEQIMPGGDW